MTYSTRRTLLRLSLAITFGYVGGLIVQAVLTALGVA